MKRCALLLPALTGALMAAALPVSAADMGWNNNSSPIYSSAPATGWSGFYAGLNAGHGWGTTSNSPALPAGTGNNNNSGWAIGGQAGYNQDMGGFVLGGEADLQWSNIGYGAAAGASGDYASRTDIFGTARARAGMPFGQVMPYATLGVAFGRGTAQTTSPTNVITSVSNNHIGWTAGVGFEAQAAPNISIKAEYLYVDLGSQAYNGLPVGNHDVAQRFGVARVGVNYRF
jgi:outer membrane immunogenic protein